MKASLLYKHCYSLMTKGPHLNAGCFLTCTSVNKFMPSCEPLCTSTASGWRTSYIVDIPAIKLSTGGSLDESDSFSMWCSLFLLWQCAGRLLSLWIANSWRKGSRTRTTAELWHWHIHRAVQDATGDPSSDITFVRMSLCLSGCQICREEIL